jgi:hypothetical protein
MIRRNVAIDLRLSRNQCRRRHHEADRLNIADPFQVRCSSGSFAMLFND